MLDTGDDNIATKSGINDDGRRVGVASEDFVIERMVMQNGHGVIVLGSEISGDVRRIYSQQLKAGVTEPGGVAPDAERFLRLKSNKQRGGIIEEIYVRNLNDPTYPIGRITDAVLRLNKKYNNGSDSEGGSYSPVSRHIRLESVRVERSQKVLYLRETLQSDGDSSLGHVGKVHNVFFNDSIVERVDNTNECDVNSANGWALSNVSIEGDIDQCRRE